MRLGGRKKRPLGERAAHARKYGGKAARKHDRDGLKRQCGKWLLLLKTCRLHQAATYITIASGGHTWPVASGSGLRLTLQARRLPSISGGCGAAAAQQAPSPHDISMFAGFHAALGVCHHQFITIYQFNFYPFGPLECSSVRFPTFQRSRPPFCSLRLQKMLEHLLQCHHRPHTYKNENRPPPTDSSSYVYLVTVSGVGVAHWYAGNRF
jgi:hypothetical protein